MRLTKICDSLSGAKTVGIWSQQSCINVLLKNSVINKHQSQKCNDHLLFLQQKKIFKVYKLISKQKLYDNSNATVTNTTHRLKGRHQQNLKDFTQFF